VGFSTHRFQLARGNPYIGMLSIGHNASDIPAPPGKFDGEVAGGIAMHGRFEGTRDAPYLDVRFAHTRH
jgi:hypothetical protein